MTRQNNESILNNLLGVLIFDKSMDMARSRLKKNGYGKVKCTVKKKKDLPRKIANH